MVVASATPVPHGMLRQNLLGQALVAIIRGDLPGGRWLVEQEMADRFGVSRTPIRETINQLASFGVVRLYPNRGAQVQPFGSEQLRDIYLVRQILESEASRLACGHIAADALDWAASQSQALADARDHSEEWAHQQMEADRSLHDLIARSCGSERLRTELQRYWTLIDAVRMSLGHRYEAREQALREHLTIIAALRSGDAQAAADAMTRHIRQTAEAAVNLMFGVASASDSADTHGRNNNRRGKRGQAAVERKTKG
jgi:DNA-binding GntR family transcriptional regulator